MKLDIPKQFYEINGKPIILYTLESFQNMKCIDEICVVYLEGYKTFFTNLIKTYKLDKIKYLTPGGSTNQMSIYNGLLCLKNIISDDDVIIIHDGIRPLVDEEVVSNNIDVCVEKGNAVAVIPCNEAMLFSENGLSSLNSIERSNVWKTQTPHSMRYMDMLNLVESVINKGITNSVAICTMLIECNHKVYFSKGNNLNFKLTNPEDIDLFKSILATKQYGK